MENVYLKILFIILLVFSIMENYLVGIITMLIFFHIITLNNKEINEGFLNYYTK
jgi:hypothetical protein